MRRWHKLSHAGLTMRRHHRDTCIRHRSYRSTSEFVEAQRTHRSEVHHGLGLRGSLTERFDDSGKRPCPHLSLLPCSFLSALLSIDLNIFSSNRVEVVLVGAGLTTCAQQRRNSASLSWFTYSSSKAQKQKDRKKISLVE
jgi:hypothetical protein